MLKVGVYTKVTGIQVLRRNKKVHWIDQSNLHL